MRFMRLKRSIRFLNFLKELTEKHWNFIKAQIQEVKDMAQKLKEYIDKHNLKTKTDNHNIENFLSSPTIYVRKSAGDASHIHLQKVVVFNSPGFYDLPITKPLKIPLVNLKEIYRNERGYYNNIFKNYVIDGDPVGNFGVSFGKKVVLPYKPTVQDLINNTIGKNGLGGFLLPRHGMENFFPNLIQGPAPVKTVKTVKPSQPSPSMTYTTDTYGDIFPNFHNLGTYSPTKLEMINLTYSQNDDFVSVNYSQGTIQSDNQGGWTGWQMNNGKIEFSYPNADFGYPTIIKAICTAPGKNPITLSFSFKVPS